MTIKNYKKFNNKTKQQGTDVVITFEGTECSFQSKAHAPDEPKAKQLAVKDAYWHFLKKEKDQGKLLWLEEYCRINELKMTIETRDKHQESLKKCGEEVVIAFEGNKNGFTATGHHMNEEGAKTEAIMNAYKHIKSQDKLIWLNEFCSEKNIKMTFECKDKNSEDTKMYGKEVLMKFESLEFPYVASGYHIEEKKAKSIAITQAFQYFHKSKFFNANKKPEINKEVSYPSGKSRPPNEILQSYCDEYKLKMNIEQKEKANGTGKIEVAIRFSNDSEIVYTAKGQGDEYQAMHRAVKNANRYFKKFKIHKQEALFSNGQGEKRKAEDLSVSPGPAKKGKIDEKLTVLNNYCSENKLKMTFQHNDKYFPKIKQQGSEVIISFEKEDGTKLIFKGSDKSYEIAKTLAISNAYSNL